MYLPLFHELIVVFYFPSSLLLILRFSVGHGSTETQKTDNTSALLVSTPSANTVYLLNTSSPTAATGTHLLLQRF
jgi:hypothetical protein